LNHPLLISVSDQWHYRLGYYDGLR